MIVDSSAIVAVLLRQPGYEPVLEQLARATAPAAGAPTLAETGIVEFEVVGDQAVIRPVVVVPLAEAERTAAAA